MQHGQEGSSAAQRPAEPGTATAGLGGLGGHFGAAESSDQAVRGTKTVTSCTASLQGPSEQVLRHASTPSPAPNHTESRC